MVACQKMNVPPSSNLIFAVHPRWSSWLLLDDHNKRLNNIEYDNTASFSHNGQSIHIRWDSAGEETFHFLDGFYVYAEMMRDYLPSEQQLFASERLGIEPWKPKTNYDLAKQQVVQGRLSTCMDAVFGRDVFIAEDAKIFTNWLRMGERSWIASAALLRHSISIGPRSGINYGVVIARKVAIGTDTHIASGTAIYGFNHNFPRA
jgi:acetyltransferase-like isoleucine patch superfamily enzyme